MQTGIKLLNVAVYSFMVVYSAEANVAHVGNTTMLVGIDFAYVMNGSHHHGLGPDLLGSVTGAGAVGDTAVIGNTHQSNIQVIQ